MTLGEHLSICYDATHGKSAGAPRDDFAKALKEDATLKAAAVARRAELNNPVVTGKCYCSRLHRDILDDVLRRAA